MASSIPEVHVGSETIFNLGPIGITNSMFGMLIVDLIILIVVFLFYKRASLIPGRIQVALESLITFFLDTLTTAFDSKEQAKKYLPLIFTLFLCFLIANQFSLIPLLGQITAGEASLFRVPTSDFSLTIAMALLVVVTSHIIVLKTAPIKHIGNFIKLGSFTKIRSVKEIPNAFLEFFLGLLDIIGEIAKVVSLSARLFGNVLAGELMVLIITYLAFFTTYLVPMPFIFLSAFSGLIHAVVFPLLSVQYIAGTIKSIETS